MSEGVPIYDYARSGDTDLLQAALKNDPSVLEKVEEETNSSLLGTAASHGNLATIVMLLDLGADLNTLGDDNWTVLHKACYQGHEEVAALLIDRGINVDAKDTNGWTALHNACADGNVSMAQLLLDRGANKEAMDNDGWTPLHLACDVGETEDNEAIVRLLVSRGASLESKDSNGETPLHRASTKGHTRMVGILLDLGADIRVADNVGWSAVHVAAAKNRGDTIRYLVSRGADIEVEDAKGWSAILVAAAANQVDAVDTLIDLGCDVNAAALDYATALYLACAKGYEKVARLLIDAGATLEGKSGGDELTPLHIATGKNHKLTALMLISKGSNVEAVDANGLTVLHRVAAKGLSEMVLLLLDHGANPGAKAQFGSTALDFAKDRKHDDVIKILTRALNGENPSGNASATTTTATAGGSGSDRKGIVLKTTDRTVDLASEVAAASKNNVRTSIDIKTTANSKPAEGRASEIAMAAADFGKRRADRRGVRASMYQQAQPMSDKEAAARAVLEDDNDPYSLSTRALNIAKGGNSSDPNARKAEAANLPPTLYSEVIRVAQTVADPPPIEPGELSVKELRRRSIAAVIAFDVSRKEEYLSDEQFVELFKMSKDEFAKLPKWKKEMKKKELGLF